jgi:ATP-dependent RNA helicase RhlE
MLFSDLGLAEPIQRALNEEKYATATPIQARAIPVVLEGRDLVGCAQTGTGKTAAFALPILQRLSSASTINGKHVARALVLCPTRELATQIDEGFRAYGRHLKVRSTVIFGGVNQYSQVNALQRGVDVIIATPGRLLDLMEQGYVDLRNIEVLVLDEADRMLDMGFIHDIRKVVAKLPSKRQTLLFSATMPSEIRKLADSLMHNPATVEVDRVNTTVDRIEERIYFVEKADKTALLAHLYEELPLTRAIVFTRTKHGADKVVKSLSRYKIRAEAIHGNKSQNARQRALDNFKAGKTALLIATDIASRGIDVDDVSHVVNFDLTHEPETYVHRIGRTARAGASGMAVSFCSGDERDNLRGIERLLKRKIQHAELPASMKRPEPKAGPIVRDVEEMIDDVETDGDESFDDSHVFAEPSAREKPMRPAHAFPSHGQQKSYGKHAGPKQFAKQGGHGGGRGGERTGGQGGGGFRPTHGPSRGPSHGPTQRPAHGPTQRPAHAQAFGQHAPQRPHSPAKPGSHAPRQGGGHPNAPRTGAPAQRGPNAHQPSFGGPRGPQSASRGGHPAQRGGAQPAPRGAHPTQRGPAPHGGHPVARGPQSSGGQRLNAPHPKGGGKPFKKKWR